MDYYNASINFGIIRRRVQSLVVEATMDLGLTYSEFSLMLMLYDKEGCSQDDMTSSLHVDKAAITRVIKILEKNQCFIIFSYYFYFIHNNHNFLVFLAKLPFFTPFFNNLYPYFAFFEILLRMML
jgi:hypothetical protein